MGWFSLALGAAELAMPRTLARLIGVEPSVTTSILTRIAGAREIASGLAILMQPRRPLPVQARVVGDVLDLGMLALAARRSTSTPRLLGGVAAVTGATALDVIAARGVKRAYDAANQPVIYSVTINKPTREVYAFYRQLSQLPRFMDYLESVVEQDARRSHWVAKLPVGKISWDAEIVDDVPGERISWQTVEGSPIHMRGAVTFTKTPGRDMTEVRVEMQLGFTGKAPSTTLAKVFAKPQIKGDLRRLKQVLETGEVLYSDASQHRRPHAAQPSEHIERKPEIYVPTTPTAQKGISA